MLYRFITCMLVFLSVGTHVLAGNWGHWRGDLGNGIAADAKPPIRWSDTENVKWKVAIPGRSSGSPAIWENRVFVVTATDQPLNLQAGATQSPAAEARTGDAQRGGRTNPLRFVTLCFDRATGELLWDQTAIEAVPHEPTHSTNTFASASPCTDGQHVYAHFGSRGLYCYTMQGEPVWKRDFGKMTVRNGFGEGSSPTLVEDMILVPWDHEGQSYLYALNKLTGETIWQVARDEPSCWATPLVIEHDGQQQIIMNGQTCARAYDLKSGNELWRCGGQTQRPVASPVAGDGLVFVGSGFRGSFLAAFRPDGRGDIEGTAHVVWSVSRDTPDIPSLLLSEDRLYFFKGKTGVLSCVDAATGKPHYWTERLELGTIYASPIAAAGHVYLTDREGTTVVIEDSAQLRVVATNSVGETVDATPAPVDNELFIRGEKHLFCITE